jgi:small-conductance mechanosensitive channel
MDWILWGIVAVGIALWLTLVFEALLGTRVVALTGRLHWRVHRVIGFTLIGVGLLHGFAALGHFVFGWF